MIERNTFSRDSLAEYIKVRVERTLGIATETEDYEKHEFNKNLVFHKTPFYQNEEEFTDFLKIFLGEYHKKRVFKRPLEEEFIISKAKSIYKLFLLPVESPGEYPGSAAILSKDVFHELVSMMIGEYGEIEMLNREVEYLDSELSKI